MHQPCITGINPACHDLLLFLYIVGLDLAKFGKKFWSVFTGILVYGFLALRCLSLFESRELLLIGWTFIGWIGVCSLWCFGRACPVGLVYVFLRCLPGSPGAPSGLRVLSPLVEPGLFWRPSIQGALRWGALFRIFLVHVSSLTY